MSDFLFAACLAVIRRTIGTVPCLTAEELPGIGPRPPAGSQAGAVRMVSRVVHVPCFLGGPDRDTV